MGCKLLTDEGDFKVDVASGKGVSSCLRRFLKNYQKCPVVWHLAVVLLVHMLSWILFALIWLLVSHKTPAEDLAAFDSFAQAFSFAVSLHLRTQHAVDRIGPKGFAVVAVFTLQSITAFVLYVLLMLLLVKAFLKLFRLRETFVEVMIDENLIFHKTTEKVVVKPQKPVVSAPERRVSVVGERKGSVVAFRKASIFWRRVSKAEGHQFRRQKATRSVRYEKLKTKKVAKEGGVGGAETFEMRVGVVEDDVIILGIYGFLLVKKKVKTALLEFVEVLASRKVEFAKKEVFVAECEYCSGVSRPKQLVHTIDKDSPLLAFMDFIVKKKKWKEKQAGGVKEEAAKGADVEFIALWPDETISVSKLELEVIVVIQYQHLHSSRLSEARRSFDLSNFRLHSPLKEDF